MTDEYISREAVCYQLEKRESIDGQPRAIRRARRIVADFPAADVVPVVRCKDCRKGIPDSEHATAYSCYGIWHKPDWFCAGGVRKDGDGE